VYTLRQYTLPFLLALMLHAGLVAWMRTVWQHDRTDTHIVRPHIVNSTLLVLEPKAPPKVVPKAAPTPPPERAARAEPAKPEPQPTKAAEPPAPDPAQLEAERRRQQEETARAERLKRLADSSFINALQDESADLADAAAADAEAAAQSYRYGIYQRIVANWSRPPSARNGMEARLQVELVPTGEVVAVMLIESSGNTAFDHSAEAAVRKARRFEVPQDNSLFEKYFRRFTLLFKPEDLLR
jgi:colicin import membrane protein